MRDGISREDFYKGFISEDSSYSAQKYLNRVYPESVETVEDKFVIKQDHMIVGFNGPVYKEGGNEYTDYEDEYAVQVNMGLVNALGEKEPKRILVAGKNKSGKTILSECFANFLQTHYGIPRFGIDIYGEYYAKRKKFGHDKGAAYQDYIGALSKRYGFELRGLRLLIMTPLMLGTQPNIDRYICLDYDYVKGIIGRSQEAFDFLAELLGISGDEANLNLLETAMSDPDIHTWKALLKKMEELKKEDPEKFKVTNAITAIETRLRSDKPVLSDNPKYAIDLLHWLKEYDMVVFKAQPRTVVDDTRETRKFNSILKFLLLDITTDLQRWLDDHDPDAVLKSDNGIVMQIDEIRSLIPKEGKSSLKNAIVMLATFWRKAMVSIVASIQSIEQIDSAFVEQMDFLVFTRLESENKPALRNSNISEKFTEGVFSKLHWGILTNVKTRVNEFSLLDKRRNYEIRTFCPIWPECDFVKRE